jgi:ubiquinone/menaquinone biosynthesis C-methylase UbiE
MTGARAENTPQGVLVGAMWAYAASVLRPAQALKRATGWEAPVTGDEPVDLPRRGLGPWLSLRHAEPVLQPAAGEHDEDVREFDRIAEVYAAFVRPFSTPIFDEALPHLERYLRPDSRVLDAGCGSGQELERVARLVPDGEVVGVDLAAGMVTAAWRGARSHGLDHTAFVQADVGRLPASFTGRFDLVYCCLAHHHYPEPELAAAEARRVLRPGGAYCIIDPGPEWYTRLSEAVARWADPGWVGFHTPIQFRELLEGAGFARTAWIDLLPGFGMAVGQKARGGARAG